MRILKRALTGVGILVAIGFIAAAVVYANINGIVRSVLEKEVPGLTFKQMEIRWNKVSISGVKLRRGGRSVFEVDSLRVYPSLRSIFSDRLQVSSIEIDRPYVYLERRKDGSLRLPIPDGMGDDKPPAKKDDSGSGGGLALSIGRVVIRDGRGDLVDHSVQGAPARLAFSDLQSTVQRIHLPAEDAQIPFELSAKLEGRRTGRVSADGWYNLKRDSAEVDLELASIFLPHAEPYYRSNRTTATLADGVLDLTTKVKMTDGRYVAQNRVAIAEVAFSRDGLFLGIPVVVFADHLKDQRKPFQVEVELEGSLKEESKLQQQLAAAVAKELGKQLGRKVAEKAVEKAAEGVGGELKKSVDTFLRR